MFLNVSIKFFLLFLFCRRFILFGVGYFCRKFVVKFLYLCLIFLNGGCIIFLGLLELLNSFIDVLILFFRLWKYMILLNCFFLFNIWLV